MNWFQTQTAETLLLVMGVLTLALFWVGILLGRVGRRHLEAEKVKLRARLARAEAQTREQTRILARMRAEKGTVASLALSLPALVRELNRSDLDGRRVPGLILQLAEAIFQPGQMLFYQTASSDPDHPEAHSLRLTSHHGLETVPDALKYVPFGEGKIGWVAEKKVEMLRADWHNPSRTDGQPVTDNHPSLQPDILGPMIGPGLEYQPHNDRVLGVLCIGSPGIRPRDEKLMFQLVTNLGSLAMINAESRSRLSAQANTDGLTGLLNKRYFLEQLSKKVFKAGEEAKPLAVFIFDIDHFKVYNDTNGHPAGDDLLRQLATLLQAEVRPGDLCCRYGGEEFIIAMPNTDGDDALRVSERIRAAIEATEFPHQQNQPTGNLTVSGGVAVMPKDGRETGELIKHADQTLYESKRIGRNRVARYRGVTIGCTDDELDRHPSRVPDLPGRR